MLLKQIQYFISVVDCNSFTEAAELHQALADFSQIYPDVAIQILGGAHEELYHMLRDEQIDIVPFTINSVIKHSLPWMI